MDYLFYCTPQKINLSTLCECLRKQGLVSSITTSTPTKAIVYHGETWFQLDEMPPPCADRFEEAQQVVLCELHIQSVFQLSFRLPLLEDLLPPVRAILANFDGWIGVDDGCFSTRMDLANIGDVPAALHSLLASMEGNGE